LTQLWNRTSLVCLPKRMMPCFMRTTSPGLVVVCSSWGLNSGPSRSPDCSFNRPLCRGSAVSEAWVSLVGCLEGSWGAELRWVA
jgi:hypothetical protein